MRYPWKSDPGSQGLRLRLRPWRPSDAQALVDAWADPEIQRWTGVPDQRDLRAAERWIAGDASRRGQDLSLDLVVERDGEVVGEVGLAGWDKPLGTIEIGWWTAERHRRQGIATKAARLVVGWASSTLGVTVVARCDVANPGSVAVAERAGAMVLL